MAEPITLADIKVHLGIIDDTSFDTLLPAYISAAREMVENYTGHILMQRDFTEYRDSFGRHLELTRRPIAEVTEVAYVDSDGEAATYADFVASIDRLPARIYPALNGWWPTLGTNGTVSITYTAGYEAGSEPAVLLHAMRLIIGHWFMNRETVGPNTLGELPFAATALMDQYRVPSL